MNASAGTELHRTTYDRKACRVGIVHLGYGAFHRAHQAVYVDDYMETTGDLNWGVAAVNLRGSESADFKQASTADEYLLKTTTPEGRRHLRLVRSHLDFADWSVDAPQAEQLIGLASVHAITITVTESGYYLNDDQSLNVDDPIIQREIEGGARQSVYAYLAAALQQRAEALDQPVTILCCDNIRENGDMLARNFMSYLQHVEKRDLADWVAARTRFPNAMVDRITPRATPTLKNEISSLFPQHAARAIHAEAYCQWVLQEAFAGPFPDLAKVGVQIVTDVAPYEDAKIRVLNGGHLGLAYLGALAGHRTLDAVMKDPQLLRHFDAYETEEVLPGLRADLPFDKVAYLDEIRARFGNEAIADSLERLCMDGYSKMPIYIRPALEAAFEQGIVPHHGFKCIASWYIYARRVAADEMPIAYHEPYWDTLRPLLAPGQEAVFATYKPLWGHLPETNPEFVPGIVFAINAMASVEARI